MKKQLLAGVLSAIMVMASMPTTAMAVVATEETTNSLTGSTISSEQGVSENESVEQSAEIETEIREIAETEKAADGVVEVNSADALQKAVKGAKDGVETTIRLVANISEMAANQIVTIPENKSIILDMNGKKLTVSNNFEGRPFRIEGTLTVVGDGSVDTESAHNAYGVFDNYGSLIVKDGTYRSYTYAGGSVVKNRPGSFCEIYSGSFYGSPTAVYNEGITKIYGGIFDGQSCSSCNSNWGYTIQSHWNNKSAAKPEFYFYDGTVIGVQGAFSTSAGYSEVHDGTFKTVACETHGKNSAHYALYVAGESGEVECNVYGGTFVAASKYAAYIGNSNDGGEKKDAIVNIYGGSFKSGRDDKIAVLVDQDLGGLNITGGTFSSDVSKYIDPSSDRQEENGQYVVKPIPKSEGVAAIGNKYYATLADAVQAVVSGSEAGTVTLLKDAAGGGIGLFNGEGATNVNLTIDFGGCTYTCNGSAVGSAGTESQAFHLETGNKVTLKNGTIKVSPDSEKTMMLIQNYCNLTLEDLNLCGSDATQYMISSNYGDTVLKNVNIDGTHKKLVAIDLMHWLGTEYKDQAPTMQIQNDADNTIKGSIDVYCYGPDAATCQAKPKLTIDGGHYAEPVNPDYLDESLKAELKSASNTEAPYSYYRNVDEAIQAAEPGDTITAIEDDSVTQSYLVSFDGNGGNAIASVTVPGNTKITLPVPTREGYEFAGWYDGDKLVESPYTVTAKVALTAHWNKISSGGGAHHPEAGSTSSSDRYEITKPSKVENGSIKVSDSKAEKGDTVTITVTPDEGYELDKLAVYDEDGDKIDLKDKGDGKFTFEMPKGDVEIEVSFALIENETVKANFADVAADAWYADAVQYVYENGMMSGTSETTFSPDLTTTRGMIVTILYRLENEPAVTGTTAFTDVAADQYYANAVAWAAQNGIVSGTTATTFAPNNAITREQMAAILYRYAQFKGYDVSVKADLSVYTDAAQVSTYATDAMAWANGAQLITGTSQAMQTPASNATRAQVATILMRFCENIAK